MRSSPDTQPIEGEFDDRGISQSQRHAFSPQKRQGGVCSMDLARASNGHRDPGLPHPCWLVAGEPFGELSVPGGRRMVAMTMPCRRLIA